jgi:protein-arginine kinase activator protein McsA
MKPQRLRPLEKPALPLHPCERCGQKRKRLILLDDKLTRRQFMLCTRCADKLNQYVDMEARPWG